MVFPLLPSFLLNVLGGSRLFLGVVEGAADTVASLLKLWSGGRSDQAGKRKSFVLFGYGVAAVTRPLLAFVTLPWQLLAIRVGDRIGKGVRSAPRDALIADAADASMRGRAFGFHQAMDHVGAAVGPLLAVGFLWLWPDQLRTLFLLTLVPGVLVAVLLLFFLRETPATIPAKEPLHLSLRPFDSNFRLYLVALVVFTLGNSSDAFLLVRAAELGVPTILLPILWCLFHIVKSAGNWVLGGVVDRFGPRPFLFVGWFLYAAVYIAFGLASTAWHIAVCFLVYALFFGLTEPAEKTLVAKLAGPERKGLAYGWYNFAIGIATLPSSLIFGALYDHGGPLLAFSWGAGLAALAALLLTAVRGQSRPA